MKLRSITELKNIAGKRVLLRIDANVPLKNGKIEDDYKLIKSLPTIRYLLRQKARIIIMSHLGRPKEYDEKVSLRPVAEYFQKKLRQPILFFDIHALSDSWKRAILAVENMQPGNILMLENIRFNADEEKNTGILAKKLSTLADIFVLDGFGVAHRDAASVTGVKKFLPTFAGLLLEEEVSALCKVLEKPRRPLVLVLGGAKMETKIPLLKNFIKKADYILLGGGILATYLHHQGKSVGTSLVEKELPKSVFTIFKNKKIKFQSDVTIGTVKGKKVMHLPFNSKFKISQADQGIYDVGPETLKEYKKILKKAKTIVWNGALGYFEQHPYQKGTYALAKMLAEQSKRGALVICGGGETEEILKKLKLLNIIDLVSTGGGAMLEFLSGKTLPGIKVLLKK